jgi:hypothetical protein
LPESSKKSLKKKRIIKERRHAPTSTLSQTVGNSKLTSLILFNTKPCQMLEQKRTPSGAADSAPDDLVQRSYTCYDSLCLSYTSRNPDRHSTMKIFACLHSRIAEYRPMYTNKMLLELHSFLCEKRKLWHFMCVHDLRTWST